jgi:hypothetical protein
MRAYRNADVFIWAQESTCKVYPVKTRQEIWWMLDDLNYYFTNKGQPELMSREDFDGKYKNDEAIRGAIFALLRDRVMFKFNSDFEPCTGFRMFDKEFNS